MLGFGKMYREYKKMTDGERRETLREATAKILPALCELNGDGVSEFIILIFNACGSYGRIDPDTYTLFCEVTGITLGYDEACRVAGGEKSYLASFGAVEGTLDTFSLLSDEAKSSTASFCLCMCAAMGKLPSRVKLFLKRLIK